MIYMKIELFFFFQSLQTDVHSHHPQVVAIKVAGQNLPVPPEGASGQVHSERKSVPQRYDELVASMDSYESQLQSTSVTKKTVKEDSQNLLRSLLQIQRKLKDLGPFPEHVDTLMNKVLQFKVGFFFLNFLDVYRHLSTTDTSHLTFLGQAPL